MLYTRYNVEELKNKDNLKSDVAPHNANTNKSHNHNS